jgi:hypothetical protein
MTGWDPSATALLQILPQTARGPKRDGVFALWLAVRVARDAAGSNPPPERAHRRRVVALQQRLSSLTLPPHLRRALAAAVAELMEGDSMTPARVLSQLVAPARDAAGPEAAEAVAGAVRAARQERTHE